MQEDSPDVSMELETVPEAAADDEPSKANRSPPVRDEHDVAREDLPFLVTHWLAHFQQQASVSPAGESTLAEEQRQQQQQASIRRIHRAAAELSSAFHDLGSFGTTTRPRLQLQSAEQQPAVPVPATYSDRRRQWSHRCPPDRLEHLLASSATTQRLVGRPVERIDLFQSSLEARTRQVHQPRSGRTLQDAIDISAETDINNQEVETDPVSFSGMDLPLVLAKDKPIEEKTDALNHKVDRNLSMVSKFAATEKESADATRNFLNLQDEYNRLKQQMQGLRKSLDLQEQTIHDFARRRQNIERLDGSIDAVAKKTALDDIEDGEQNASRVIAQLKRQLDLLEKKDVPLAALLEEARVKKERLYKQSRSTMQSFRDPFYSSTSNMNLARNLVTRAFGLTVLPLPTTVRKTISAQVTSFRKSVNLHRMSHAATINTHLAYPIYCLRFDRTGRYFVTGADDYLSRVYCLGSHAHAKPGSGLDPLSYQRGAVLVCTLRGHAGVINDIAISSDNAFLATASEDGDCRVWGLRDGSPIAILRGHTGGANMVSWSTLTPYRLVTAGADGYARSWDIREACVLRYRSFVGKRLEYRRRKGDEQNALESNHQEGVSLPPIPVRNEEPPPPARGSESDGEAAVPLPPLPPGQQEVGEAQPAVVAAAETEEPGRFVAGSEIDEGVRLLSKMQHGASFEERMSGHGTRSRRASVKVLCVDVCPLGHHVATGADDGICRIFSASDDVVLERLDMKESAHCATFKLDASLPSRQSTRQLVSGRLLVTLKGHLTAITDLKYSSAGDRLMSASQRDGVVRIWSWDGTVASGETLNVGSPSAASSPHAYHVNHILIKLTNPEKAVTADAAPPNRQRPSRSSTSSSISCDSATWFNDDSKIATSQCELVKQSSSEIQPGSQYIFIWDSSTGQCLLGIHGAHTKQCPVVLSHPLLPAVICSAGADGIAKLWDLEKGECLLEHKNTVDFGPVEARDKGMTSGYLDGSFSPDGTEVVLTDDSGRVSVFDCAKSPEGHAHPAWMREQYFANDYYDLFYDRHGYCIERGSEQPPHLAPRGVRCVHSGAPWGEEVNAAFKGIRGPLPEPEKDCLWKRLKYRLLSRISQKKPLKRNVVSQFDPTTTVMIGSASEEKKKSPVSPPAEERNPATRNPRLSSNWRWRDYSDILREEDNFDDEADADDDSYELNDRSNRRTFNEDDDDSDSDSFESETSIRGSRRTDSASRPTTRPSRNGRRSYGDLLDSSDDELDEYVSSVNTPSGPFRADFEVYHFRVTSGISSIERSWVHRIESSSSFLGRKSYCPQVGDVVVYIPRAHFDVIKDLPSVQSVPPWQSWPDGAEWPVVRCVIRSIRYRFPFRVSFRKNKSIVAILTLEATGIPELSQERELPFPKPVFVDLPGRRLFEVSVFQTDSSDFIVPIGLYSARLDDLESAMITDNPEGLEFQSYWNESEDDAEFSPYRGTITAWNDEPDLDSGDPNLIGSGYHSLLVSWENGDQDRLSPWEVALEDSSIVSEIHRPRLSEAEKQQVRDALSKVRLIDNVERFFLHPIDTSRYTDYESRVENPMWIDYVRTRLDTDYYSNRLSVIYDLKLIRENSRKYNGQEDELTGIASQMYENFCQLVLADEEREEFLKFEKDLEENAAPSSPNQEDSATVDAENGGLNRRTRRHSQRRSSLESLPAPESDPTVRRPMRQRSSRNSNGSISQNADRGQRRRGRRGGDRISESALVAQPVAPIIPMNSGNRGRTTRNSRGQQPSTRHWRSAQQSDSLAASRAEQAASRALRLSTRRAAAVRGDNNVPRRPHRNSAGRPTYADPDEDDDIAQSELEEMNAVRGTSSRTTRSAVRRSTRNMMPEAGTAGDTSENEEVVPPPRTGGSAVENYDSDNTSHPPSDETEEEVETDTSQGGRSKKRRIQTSDESAASHNGENDESSEDSDASELKPTSPSTRRKSRSSPARRATRSRNRPTYEEHSSDEFDDFMDDEEEEEEESEDMEAKRASKKSSSQKPPKKKTKKNGGSPARPELAPWPQIEMRSITNVTKEIVERLSGMDEGGLFAIPVVEAYPHLADEYASLVDHPMDFRTILEEGLPRYKSIRELQEDLVTVFHNCLVFNGEISEYGILSRSMLDAMEAIFKSVCEDLGVQLPTTRSLRKR